MTSLVLIWFSTVAASSVALALAWPWKCMVLALAWPWAVLKVLGLEFSGLGLMTCGLINITGGRWWNLGPHKSRLSLHIPLAGTHTHVQLQLPYMALPARPDHDIYNIAVEMIYCQLFLSQSECMQN